MKSLDSHVKLTDLCVLKLKRLSQTEAQAQAYEYQQRYGNTARRFNAMRDRIEDERFMIRNKAISEYRNARAFELLAQWLTDMDVKDALAQMATRTWRDVYRELGIDPMDDWPDADCEQERQRAGSG